MLAPLERVDIPMYYNAKKDFISPPSMLDNPLLDVKIPSAIIDPDSPSYIAASLDLSAEPAAVLGTDSQNLEPPSFNLPAPSRPTHRNPLRDIKLPNAIVAPEFQHIEPPSVSPIMRSARSFNSIACPPQLLPQEWYSFTSELERTAASSGMSRTSLEIAIGILPPAGYSSGGDDYVWGKWHHLPVQREGQVDSEGLGKAAGEGVGRVVERYNENWAARGVKVAFEVTNKERRMSGGSISD